MVKRSTFIAIVVSLSVTLVALIVSLIIFITTTNIYATQLENTYMRSFYELTNNIDDIEVELSKLIATNSNDSRKLILTDLYNICNVANTNVSNVPVSSETVADMNKYINQLGGFCYSLLTKIEKNQNWSDADFESIEGLHTYGLNLMTEFNRYVAGLNADFSLLALINHENSRDSEFNATFENIQSTNSQVPTLIYDGPFADSTMQPDIKGLPSNEVTADEAKAIIQNNFTMYSLKSVTYVNETTGLFTTYNFKVETNDGLSLYVQITKLGGIVLEITSYGNGGEGNLTRGQCEDVAKTFARSLGYNDLYPVWSTVSGKVAYVNLAPVVNGVIYYPDLIKVKVDRGAGVVSGWEAKNYCYNHVERNTSAGDLTITQAEAFVSPLLNVLERNKTIIPLEYGQEKQAYEYVCTWKNYVYYVYLDINTGAELNILRVLNTNAGELII